MEITNPILMGIIALISLITPFLWVYWSYHLEQLKRTHIALIVIAFIAAPIGVYILSSLLLSLLCGGMVAFIGGVGLFCLWGIYQIIIVSGAMMNNKTREKMKEYHESEEFKRTGVDYLTKNQRDSYSRSFDDEFCKEIEWNPMEGGGRRFKMRKFSKKEGQLIYMPSLGLIAFYSLFFIAGTFMIHINDLEGAGQYVIPIVVLAMFLLLNKFLKDLRPMVFDSNRSEFRRGWGQGSEGVKKKKSIQLISFEMIHAVQVVGEYFNGSDGGGSSSSYELNLVLKDKSRIHIMDYKDEEYVLTHANHISEMVKIPIWDKSKVQGRALAGIYK